MTSTRLTENRESAVAAMLPRTWKAAEDSQVPEVAVPAVFAQAADDMPSRSTHPRAAAFDRRLIGSLCQTGSFDSRATRLGRRLGVRGAGMGGRGPRAALPGWSACPTTRPTRSTASTANWPTWWPLISPPEEYVEEAGFVAGVLGAAGPVAYVLELGSGGGHNAVHLKQRFAMTLVDLSEEMLDVSRRLNPECEHQQGDMRTVRLGRTFDAVFVHDAVDYMTSRGRPATGGADRLRTLPARRRSPCSSPTPPRRPSRSPPTTAADASTGGFRLVRGVRYLEWTWDPDPTDSWVQTEYSFLLRDDDGSVRAVHETHRTGIFHRDVWLEVLTTAGFEASDRSGGDHRGSAGPADLHRPPPSGLTRPADRSAAAAVERLSAAPGTAVGRQDPAGDDGVPDDGSAGAIGRGATITISRSGGGYGALIGHP